ncbi:Cotton fiber protein [Hirschfeldia incana]|nr:Cotton fiber protein [Hirschfeldia incana]
MADPSKKKNSRSLITHKAWSLVRMALLWARKGGVFKRWPLLELRNLLSKHLKALAHHNNSSRRYLSRYGERELSFDETPLFNAKKKKTHLPTSMRFLLPCIGSPIEFDYEFEMDGQDYSDEVISYGYDESGVEECDRTDKDDEEEDEKGVDVRAEEFIAKFYEQIKLQRQISYMKYRE